MEDIPVKEHRQWMHIVLISVKKINMNGEDFIIIQLVIRLIIQNQEQMLDMLRLIIYQSVLVDIIKEIMFNITKMMMILLIMFKTFFSLILVQTVFYLIHINILLLFIKLFIFYYISIIRWHKGCSSKLQICEI